MSLINFNPTKMKIDRRKALTLGAGALTTAASPAFAMGQRQTSGGESLNLDFSKPEDNLTAWVKLASSLEEGKETCGYYKGDLIAVLGPDQVNVPLMGYEGFGMSRVTKLPDGRYENLHREVSYYTDPRSGEILEEWKNPFTEEVVKVYPTHNDPVNSYYSTTFKQTFGEEGAQETVEFPFILPWDIVGDRVVVTFQVHTRWPSPFKKADWPREYIGEWYKTTEHFQIHTNLSELNDPGKMKAASSGAWTKEAPWIPWMLMEDIPGRLLYITKTFQMASTDDLPPKIREYTEKNYPIHMTAPTEWQEPNMTTFETWITEMTPAKARS